MTPTEEWRAVVGYEGLYEVSDQGRVRSLPRLVYSGGGRYRRHPMTVLTVYRGNYSKVRLKVDGRGATKNVHALVAAAFLGPRPDGMEVCHNNGRHHDNRSSNLRYDTHAANQLDQVAHGTHFEARRLRCAQGHPFSPENTLQRSDGGRRCKTCDTARGKRRWQEELERRATA